jgi:hypothetical protein
LAEGEELPYKPRSIFGALASPKRTAVAMESASAESRVCRLGSIAFDGFQMTYGQEPTIAIEQDATNRGGRRAFTAFLWQLEAVGAVIPVFELARGLKARLKTVLDAQKFPREGGVSASEPV